MQNQNIFKFKFKLKSWKCLFAGRSEMSFKTEISHVFDIKDLFLYSKVLLLLYLFLSLFTPRVQLQSKHLKEWNYTYPPQISLIREEVKLILPFIQICLLLEYAYRIKITQVHTSTVMFYVKMYTESKLPKLIQIEEARLWGRCVLLFRWFSTDFI